MISFRLTLLLACFFLSHFMIVLPSYASMAQNDTGRAIIEADKNPQNWLSYGRTYSEQHYSPLQQINLSTIGKLKLAWYVPLHANRGQEGTPLVVDGVMYATTTFSRIKAIQADTGKILWSYDPKVPGRMAKIGCCDPINRGPAYWNGKVYFATLDGRLVALNAKTGKIVWEINTIPKDANLGQHRAYTVSGEVRAAKGMVFIGNSGTEFGIRGFVSAFDAETGKLKWRFFLVPNNKNKPDHAASDEILMTKAYKTWGPQGVWATQGGGGAAWDSMIYDPVTDLFYIGAGNGGPWNYKYRSQGVGANLFIGSVVAVRPETGKYVWHFQETPMDTWDYTSTQPIMALDLPIDGKMRHVLVHAPKNGFFYMIDAWTGKFISGRNFSYQNFAKGLDPLTGRPIFRPQALWSLNGTAWDSTPGPFGAHNFMAMAYSPKTQLVYIPEHQIPTVYAGEKGGFSVHPDSYNVGLDLRGTGLADTPKARKDYVDKLEGSIVAWDPIHMEQAWKIQHKGPWNGGILATAGDLIFQGLADGHFHAYDATNGRDLFDFNAQSGIMANPITYRVHGKQYVAVEVGWGGSYPVQRGGTARTAGWTVNHSYVAAFALDGKGKIPQFNNIGSLPVKPPQNWDEKRANKGYVQYERYCQMCHGDNVEAGGINPDLRWSGSIATRDAFYHVVGEGALTAYGMDGFRNDMSGEEIEDIRQFIIQRAHQTYPREVHARQNPKEIPKKATLGL